MFKNNNDDKYKRAKKTPQFWSVFKSYSDHVTPKDLFELFKHIHVKYPGTLREELLGRATSAVFHWLPRFPYFVHSLMVWVPSVEMLMFKVFIVAPYMW